MKKRIASVAAMGMFLLILLLFVNERKENSAISVTQATEGEQVVTGNVTAEDKQQVNTGNVTAETEWQVFTRNVTVEDERQLTVQLYGKRNLENDCLEISRMKVYDGKELLQIIRVQDVGYAAAYDEKGAFFIEDINFDGDEEIALCSSTEFELEDTPYYYWIWNRFKETFDYIGCDVRQTYEEYTVTESVEVNPACKLTVKLYGLKDIYSGYYGIRQMDIYDEDTLIQTIVMQDVFDVENNGNSMSIMQGYTACRSKDGDLIYEDVNFDGNQDIGLTAFIPAVPNDPVYYWIWNEEERQFVYAFRICNLEIDEENRQLVSRTRGSVESWNTIYYEYDEEEKLQPVKLIEENYSDGVVNTYRRADEEWVLENQTTEGDTVY